MKKICFGLSLLISSSINAQNVGIGNTNPTEKLQVTGNVQADTVKVNGLILNDGILKVSGAAKTAFIHTATPANTVGDYTKLSYPNQLQTDIIIITHNYSPPGGAIQYLNSPSSVWWTGLEWAIYNDDLSNMVVNNVGKSFNVLVIKQ